MNDNFFKKMEEAYMEAERRKADNDEKWLKGLAKSLAKPQELNERSVKSFESIAKSLERIAAYIEDRGFQR